MTLLPILVALLLPLQVFAVKCDGKGIYLECSNLNVDELVANYKDENTLKLSNLTGLKSWNSTELTSVNTIILNDGQLSSEAFRDLVNLQHLSTLEISGIDNLNVTTENFPKSSNLRSLTITKCKKCSVKLDLLRLSEVDLSESTFDEEPVLSDSVQFLNLSATVFTKSKENTRLVSEMKLQELDLSYKNLNNAQLYSFFQSNSSEMNTLEKLWVNNNALTTFHAWLPGLLVLNLNNNKFTSLDLWSILGANDLTTLYLSGNNIRTMTRFSSLHTNTLKVLDLSDNLLEEINAQWLEKITELEILKLSQNSIKNLPDLTTDFNNLHNIDLSSNQLGSLNKEFFRRIPNLAVLDVSKNKLTEINQATPYLGNLNRLFIAENKLVIHKTTFGPLTALNYLDASENSLNCTLSVFNKNSALRNLYLNSNNIAELCDVKESVSSSIEYLFLKNNQVKSLRCLSKVRYLDVENNPLECTKELKEKLIELADSVDIIVPATGLVEVFNHSALDLVDGAEMFEKLCPNWYESSTASSIVKTTEPELPVEEIDPVTPVLASAKPKQEWVYYNYDDDDDDEDSTKLNDIEQSQKESILDVDNNLKFVYHGERVNKLAVFSVFLSIALGIVLCMILIVYIYYKCRARLNADLRSDRPYKPLKNEVYKTTTSGIDNNRNIAQVFSKFRNEKLDEIMIKFGFKWNNRGDVESEARMIPT